MGTKPGFSAMGLDCDYCIPWAVFSPTPSINLNEKEMRESRRDPLPEWCTFHAHWVRAKFHLMLTPQSPMFNLKLKPVLRELKQCCSKGSNPRTRSHQFLSLYTPSPPPTSCGPRLHLTSLQAINSSVNLQSSWEEGFHFANVWDSKWEFLTWNISLTWWCVLLHQWRLLPGVTPGISCLSHRRAPRSSRVIISSVVSPFRVRQLHYDNSLTRWRSHKNC